MPFKSSISHSIGKYLEVYDSASIGLQMGVGDGSNAGVNTDAKDESAIFFPPYSSVATLDTTFSCPDDKIGFSTDKITFQDPLTVSTGDVFYVEWGTDILSAAQGSEYSSTVGISYDDLGINETVNITISSIDKVPDPFTFTDQVDTLSNGTVVSNSIAMLGSINAPTYLWGSSDSSNAQVSIGKTEWMSIPSTPGGLVIDAKDDIRVRHYTNTGSETLTNTTINIGYSNSAGAFESDVFTTTNQSIGVEQPQITYPTNGSTGESIWEMRVVADTYSQIGNAGTLASTFWEVATDSSFSNIVTSETVNSSATSWDVTTYALEENTSYHVRVTYNSSLGYSATSPSVSFTTGSRLFTYLDARDRSTYTLPTLTPYHTIIQLNFQQGNDGVGGVRGQNVSDGSPGPGGSQGQIRVSTTVKGSSTSISIGGGTNVTPVTSGSSSNASPGTTSSVLAFQLGTDKDGNPITVADIFSDAVNISGGSGGSRGQQFGSNNGGGGGGGAGGITFSYNESDTTWSEVGGVPSTFPTGATGGNNSATDSGQRYAYGGTGGNGWGAGAGGGAGGSEFNGSHGGPGGGGSPGASAGAIVLIL